jgi:ADP-heptose:LPS heptosyltransferase
MPGSRPNPIPDTAPAPVALGPRPRILAIKLATLGDLLLATPALRALRRRYPTARLDLLTTTAAAPLLTGSPLLDHIYGLDLDLRRGRPPLRELARSLRTLAALRATHYDAVLLLHHLTMPAGRLKHRALVRALAPRLAVGLDNGHGAWLDLRVPDQGFGARHEAEYTLAVARAVDAELPPGERDLRLSDLGWGDIGTRAPRSPHSPDAPLIVALHPGSGAFSLARRWPIARFAELARALHASEGARILVVAGPDEEPLVRQLLASLDVPEWIAAVHPETPRALAETLSGCALFVGNDSFPMHLAAALGVPVVAVFGPTNAGAWAPYAPGNPGRALVVRRGDLPCSPCIYRGHVLGTPEGCPARPCLTELPAEPVIAAARRLLTRVKASAAAPAG